MLSKVISTQNQTDFWDVLHSFSVPRSPPSVKTIIAGLLPTRVEETFNRALVTLGVRDVPPDITQNNSCTCVCECVCVCVCVCECVKHTQ